MPRPATNGRCSRPVRATRCTHCAAPLIRVVTGNIIDWAHNPASPTGRTCPLKKEH